MHEPDTLTVTGDSGVRINVWDYGGNGPPLLLTHCTGAHGRVWDPLVPPLLDRFHVYAQDTRGHGESEKPADPDAYAWTVSGRDTLQVLRAIAPEGAAFAAGHSAGATHLCYAALDDPRLIARAVLVDPIIAPPGSFNAPNRLAEAARRRRPEFPSTSAAYERYASRPPLGSWDPAVLQAYVEHGFENEPGGGVRLKCPPKIEAAVFERGGAYDLFDRIAGITMPVLLLTASASDVLQFAKLQRDRFPNCRFHEFPDTSHFIPQERPADVTAMMLAWFGVCS